MELFYEKRINYPSAAKFQNNNDTGLVKKRLLYFVHRPLKTEPKTNTANYFCKAEFSDTFISLVILLFYSLCDRVL
jgi:hypothetical protein